MSRVLSLLLCLFAGASQAALIGRAPTISGGTDYQAYYDDALNITWFHDANYAVTTGFDADGRLPWDTAVAFAGSMNSGSGLLGLNDWRLPAVFDEDNDGCSVGIFPVSTDGGDCGYNVDTSTGEMASLYYDTLGNLAFFRRDGSSPVPNSGLENTGPFINFVEFIYWSGTEDVTNANAAWYFGFPVGSQRPSSKISEYHALLVIDGDPLSAAVPAPAAVWLFASGLGLLGFVRRKYI